MSIHTSHMAGRAHQFTSKDVSSFRANEEIEAGLAVQRNSSDPEECEIHDGSGGEFLGIVVPSIRADQDADPVHYEAGEPVPVARPGEMASRIAKFAETASEGDGIAIINDGTNDGQLAPDSTATTSTTIDHKVDVAPDQAGSYGAIDMRPGS